MKHFQKIDLLCILLYLRGDVLFTYIAAFNSTSTIEVFLVTLLGHMTPQHPPYWT